MSRVSSVVFATVAAAIAIATTGCQAELTIKSKTRYVEQGVVLEDTSEWAGQPIEIKIEGVGASVNGGVTVVADPTATKVRATARMLAMALPEEKENADKSIMDAKNTFTISNDGSGVKVSCGHGGKYGSSEAGESGCELVEIVVPAGSADQKLDIKVLSGNGTMTLRLSQAVIGTVGANAASGDITAQLPATPGGTISLVSERADDITANLPADFAADEIILQADADKIALGSFSDIKNGAGAGGRGEAGAGLASLKLTTKPFAGSTGSITLQ